MQILNWISINCFIFLASFSLSSLYKNKSIVSFLNKTFLFYLFIIFSIQISLGIFKSLNIFAISIISYPLAITIFFINRKKLLKQIEKLKKKKITLNWQLLIYLPIFLFLLIESFNALTSPVWEFDGISYHLPIAVKWFQTENIFSIHNSVYASPLGYYPANGSLLTNWFLQVGNSSLANFQNIILYIFFIFSSLSLSKLLKVKENYIHILTALLCYSPIILKEVGTPHHDLIFNLSFIYSFIFLYKLYNKFNAKNLILFSISIGIFLGSKYLAVPYSVPFFLVLFWFIFKKCKKKFNLKTFTKYIFIFSIFSFFGGIFWYFRNIILTQNPLFPASINFFGIEVFEGYGNTSDKLASTSILNNLKNIDLANLSYLTKRFFYRTGAFVLILMLINLQEIIVTFKKFKQKKQLINFKFILLITNIFFLGIYLSAPYSYNDFDANIRYAFPLVITSSILLVLSIERSKTFKKLAWPTTLVLIFLTTFYTLTTSDLPHKIFNLDNIKSAPFLFSLFSLKIFIFFCIIYLLNKKKNFTVSILILVCSFYLPIFSFNSELREFQKKEKWNILLQKYPQKFTPIIKSFEYIDQNFKPEVNLAYSGFPFHFHLYDSRLERKVDYVNINNCQNCNYFDFKNEEEGILSHPNKFSWSNNLRKKEIDYFILFNQDGFLKYEDIWLKDNFKIVSKIQNQIEGRINEVIIYKIK